MEAFDKDVVGSDFIGRGNPIKYTNLTQTDNSQAHEVDLYDDKYKHTGKVLIKTQYVKHECDPLPTNVNGHCQLQLRIIEANWFKDLDTFG